MPYDPSNPLAGFSVNPLYGISPSQMTGTDPKRWLDILSVIGATMQDVGGSLGGYQSNALGSWQEQQQKQAQQNAQDVARASLSTAFIDANRSGKPPSLASLAPILASNPALAKDYLPLIQAMQPATRDPYTLQEGAKRFGPNGELLAENPKTVEPPEQWRAATPEEIAARGLPKGTAGQVSLKTQQFRSDYTPPQPRLLTAEEEAQQARLRAAGRPQTDVRVSTGESYAETLAKGLAGQDLEVVKAANTAPQRIQVAQRVVKTLDQGKAITGSLAEQRLGIARLFATAGLTSADTVEATDNLVSDLANQTLLAIPTSGLGGGQGFTEADKNFLRDAAAGRIEKNPANIRRIAKLNEKAGRASIRAGRKIADRLRANPDTAQLAAGLNFEAPPMQISGAEDYNSLDPGEQYIDPNGVLRTKGGR